MEDTSKKTQNNTDEPEEFPVNDDEDDFSSPNENKDTQPEEKQQEIKEEIQEGGEAPQKRFFNDEMLRKLSAAKKPAIIAASAIAGLLLAAYIFCIATLPTDTVARNVYVENLNLSGLTYDVALESIKQTYLFENKTITLVNGDQTFTMSGADIGLSAVPEETAQKAFSYGKTGNTLRDAFTSFRLLFGKHVLVPVAQADSAMLDTKLNEFGIQIHGELTPHSIEIAQDKAIITPGHTGYNGDPSTARAQVMDSMLAEQFSDIPVTLESAPPPDLTVDQVDAFVYKDTTDAYFVVENNEVSVVPEQNGQYINRDEAAAILPNVHEGGEPVEIPVYTSYAAKTAETLNANLFNGTMASYSTSYGGSTANRASNVARAAELINGTVLAPGEVFSFNDTVGERTVENGFSTAKEYVDGKSVDGIGGGTCQVSSTLYSAVLYASLEIVTRTNHMFTVSYIPNGQDATVSDSGVDFKFRNNSEYPVKIIANAGGGTISVSLVGTGWDPPRKVSIVNNSTTLPNGAVSTTTVRYTYDLDGNLVDTHTLPSSRYDPYPSSSN